ncbi:MAG: efflux RND transporter periplasmic adaptor subunit [Pseudomonadales bacterium]
MKLQFLPLPLSTTTLIGIVLQLCIPTLHAADLELSADEAGRLGVRTEQPRAVANRAVLSAPGRIVVPPGQDRVVAAVQAGLLTQLFVGSGDQVAVDTPLAEITSPELMTLQTRFLDAHTALGVARAAAERDRGLLEDGIISQRRLQATEAALAAAEAEHGNALSLLKMSGMTTPEVDALLQDKSLSARVLLRAPSPGEVLEVYGRVGERFDALAPVVRIAALEPLWLVLTVPESQAGLVQPDMLVIVDQQVPSGAAAPDSAPSGRVLQVGSMVHPASQSVDVRALLASGGLRLRPGQQVNARLFAPCRGAAGGPCLAVPRAALMRHRDATWIVRRGRAGFRVDAVVPIAEDADYAYFSGALAADDEVVVGGIAALKALWLAEQQDG